MFNNMLKVDDEDVSSLKTIYNPWLPATDMDSIIILSPYFSLSLLLALWQPLLLIMPRKMSIQVHVKMLCFTASMSNYCEIANLLILQIVRNWWDDRSFPFSFLGMKCSKKTLQLSVERSIYFSMSYLCSLYFPLTISHLSDLIIHYFCLAYCEEYLVSEYDDM
jgi:hypothetical protein